MKEYQVKFIRCGRWYAAFVPDIPGAHSQGRTLAEARRNISEAIELILEANRRRCRAVTRGRKVISAVVHVAA